MSRLAIEHNDLAQVERLWHVIVLRNAYDAQRDDAPRCESGRHRYESDNANHQGAASYAARVSRASGPAGDATPSVNTVSHRPPVPTCA